MAGLKLNNKIKKDNKYAVLNALKNGNIFTRLSCICMGLGNIVCGQIAKGVLYLALEVAFIWFMISNGIGCLTMLPGLGENE